MLVIEPATAFCPTRFSRLLSHSRTIPSSTTCNKITTRRSNNHIGKTRIRASADELTAKPQRYHPSEDISDSEDSDENGDAILGPAETSRTVIEVNSKAMLMFSGLVGDGVHENIFWPDLPYVTDEHGNVYFQVKNDEDILQTLTSEDTLVQFLPTFLEAEAATVAAPVTFLQWPFHHQDPAVASQFTATSLGSFVKGVAFCHVHGLHRDRKPHTLMIDRNMLMIKISTSLSSYSTKRKASEIIEKPSQHYQSELLRRHTA